MVLQGRRGSQRPRQESSECDGSLPHKVRGGTRDARVDERSRQRDLGTARQDHPCPVLYRVEGRLHDPQRARVHRDCGHGYSSTASTMRRPSRRSSGRPFSVPTLKRNSTLSRSRSSCARARPGSRGERRVRRYHENIQGFWNGAENVIVDWSDGQEEQDARSYR